MKPEILVAALLSLEPQLTEDTAREHVYAADKAAEETGFSTELLLAIAYVESRYDGRSLSWRSCAKRAVCTRKVGRWFLPSAPPASRPSWYCGAMQVGGHVPWPVCVQLMQDTQANYLEGARELRRWHKNVRYPKGRPCAITSPGSRSRLTCALLAYNGGYPAFVTRTTGWYSERVLTVMQRIRRRAVLPPRDS